jgi:hypothetical protein
LEIFYVAGGESEPAYLLKSYQVLAVLLLCCCVVAVRKEKTAIKQQYSSKTTATNQVIYKNPPGSPNPDKRELQCRKNENKFYRASVCTLIFRL